jgi:hypothetical protein
MSEVLAAAAYDGSILAMGRADVPGARNRKKKKGDEAATSSPLTRYGAPVDNGNRGFSATPDAVAAGLVSIFTAASPLPQARSESTLMRHLQRYHRFGARPRWYSASRVSCSRFCAKALLPTEPHPC